MNIGFHHFFYRYGRISSDNFLTRDKRFQYLIGKGVYIISVLGIAAVAPQIFNIWFLKDTVGVSLLTWTGFLTASIFWFFYGAIHREKPIILTNIAAILADILVIIGLLVFGHS